MDADDSFNLSCSSIDTMQLDQFDEKLLHHTEDTKNPVTNDITSILDNKLPMTTIKHSATKPKTPVQSKTALTAFTNQINRQSKRPMPAPRSLGQNKRVLGQRPSGLSKFMDHMNKSISKRNFQSPVLNNNNQKTCVLSVDKPSVSHTTHVTTSCKSNSTKNINSVNNTNPATVTKSTTHATKNTKPNTEPANSTTPATSGSENSPTNNTKPRKNPDATHSNSNSTDHKVSYKKSTTTTNATTKINPNNSTKTLDPTSHPAANNPISTTTSNPTINTRPASNTEFTREMCDLRKWALPVEVLARYADVKITHMFPWQAECLSMSGVLEGRNLVYCAPTSAGKTLVAELLLIKRVLETKRKVLFVLPFVSVAHEKTSYLKGILGETSVKVGGFFGTKAPPPGGLAKVHVAVCTIEKANNIVNRMMEDKTMDELGCVVVDEIHMVGDKSRGYLLELLLTKILFHCRKTSDITNTVQIIGMSATLPNLDLLSTWLDASLYITHFRPVPLTQHVKVGDVVYDVNGNAVRQLPHHSSEHMVFLCQETLKHGHNVLIFCSTKAWTEKLAELISREIVSVKQALNETLVLDVAGLADIQTQLQRLPMSVDPTLAKTINCGVAFHHAGLTVDEREVVEKGFRNSVIRVLVATSTLSAGVNLPARRVIIRSPKFGPGLMSPLVYQQMCGRAGRKGVDVAGESILICSAAERNLIPRIISSPINPVSSCLLTGAGIAIKRALLEVIASGTVKTDQQIQDYYNCTLVSVEHGNGNHGNINASDIEQAIKFLEDFDFIESNDDSDGIKTYKATKLGLATLNGSLPPDEALALLSHLQKARRNFNLESELQLVYEVTPLSISYSWPSPAWYEFYKLWERYPASYRRAGINVGVSEGYLARAASGFTYNRTEEQKLLYQTHLRFFAASALLDAINEVPLDAVAKKYHTNRGLLQTLQSAASSYAGQVAVFSNRLGFNTLSLLLSDLQSRLFSGVQAELCDLVRIELLSGTLARQLYNAGYTGVASLCQAQPEVVRDILHDILPFKSEDEVAGKPRSWLDKRHGLTELEAAAAIIHSAKELMKEDLSRMNVQIDLGDIINHNKSSKKGMHITTSKSSRSNNSLYKDNPATSSTTSSPNNSSSNTSNQSVLAIPPNITPSKCDVTQTDMGQNILNVTPDPVVPEPLTPKPGPSRREAPETELARPLTPKPEPSNPASLCNSFGADKDKVMSPKSTDAVPTVIQLQRDAIPISSSFDEFNLSAWDFLDVDEDLMDKVEPKDTTISPKRALSSPKNSPVKKLKLSSPKKSPINRLRLDAAWKSPTSKKSPMRRTRLCFKSDNSSEKSSSAKGKQLSRDENKTAAISSEDKERKLPQNIDDSFMTLDTVDTLVALRGPSDMHFPAQSDTNHVPQQIQNKANASPLKRLATQTKCVQSPIKSIASQPTAGYSIIDVTGNDSLFYVFMDEWRAQKKYSVALAWEFPESIVQHESSVNQYLSFAENQSTDMSCVENADIVGIAVCWGGMDSYYINLKDVSSSQTDVSTPPIHEGISVATRMKYLREKLQDTDEIQRIGFDMKTQWKLLATSCNINIEEDVLDCKVAAWLLNPDSKEHTFISLVSQYIPEFLEKCGLSGNSPHIPSTPRLRCCVDALLAWYLHKALQTELENKSLQVPYLEVEAPCIRTLARMEMNGFGFSVDQCKSQQDLLVTHMNQLETVAYKLAGSSFSLSSPADISQILYQRLHLPAPQQAAGRKLRAGKPRTYSTAKDVLQKLSALHPLPGIILEWRQVSHALSKTLGAIQVNVVECSALGMSRLHPISHYHTSTGRISFHEPNVQNINKEFPLDFPEAVKKSHPSFVPKTANLRSIFVPYGGSVLVAADYSQLELRIMAHLSGDKTLRQQLNSGGDVFCAIAAQWKGCSASDITPQYRQQAKQICYGILYGMGAKGLAEKLEVSEADAGMFMETFKDKYTGLKTYIRNTIKFCRDNGYVKTVLGRRRYLAHITSSNDYARAQAERQCVNTTIQGSAADLVKVAMINIDRRLQEDFSDTRTCHNQLNIPTTPKGAFLVLQLHDELIYEVQSSVLNTVARLIKEEMENALTLKVVLPVKLKQGVSWGDMTDFDI